MDTAISDNRKNDTSKLQPGFTTIGAWALGVGALIGSMAWLIHAPMIATAGNLGATLAWLIAGVLSIPLALILMELSSMFPTAGGPYFYKYYALKRLIPGYGDLLGFLTGWLFWIALTVGLAMMSIGLVNLLVRTLSPGCPLVQHWLFGPFVIVTLFLSTAVLNLHPARTSSKVSIGFCLLKIFMAAGFVLLVISSSKWSMHEALKIVNPGGSSNLHESIASVLMLALTGFTFLEITGCTSAETYNAEKAVPKAMMLTLLTGAIVFGTISFCSAGIIPLACDNKLKTMVISGTALEATCPGIVTYVAGTSVGELFFGCVIASIVGGTFGALLALARVGYSMSASGLFPLQFANTNRDGVPVYALWFQCFCVIIIALSTLFLSRLGWFPNAYVFLGETFGFMYSLIGVLYAICFLSLRYTDPKRERPFQVGSMKAAWSVSIITIIIWSYAAIGCVQPIHQLTGLFIMFSGVPVYYFYKNRSVTRI